MHSSSRAVDMQPLRDDERDKETYRTIYCTINISSLVSNKVV